MPNIKSAKKRLRQNIARRLHNRSAKSELRTLCRKVREAVEAGNTEEAEAEFRLATKKLDRAGDQRVIHPNAAARVKSRLSARIKALKQGKAPASNPATG
ncbi:MAG: 30S ribosomal protein S20 [Pirellulales bacterium]|nr:30S ribosomal protein S20 [Pirellulales bacterium]